MSLEASSRSPIDVQSLSRSCNEVLILSVLLSGPHHGYQLALELEEKSGGAFSFKHGTLYPILHKLERDGLIEGAWLAGKNRRRRKSYRLTKVGQHHLEQGIRSWRDFFKHFFDVLGR